MWAKTSGSREKIFGPVLSVLPFAGEEEAAGLANATDYGLAAGIFTRDIDRVLRFARDIRAGYVQINEYFAGGMVSLGGEGEMIWTADPARDRLLRSLEHLVRDRRRQKPGAWMI